MLNSLIINSKLNFFMYKKFIFTIFLQLFFIILLSCTEVNAKHTDDIRDTDETCCGGRCTGSTYCTACRNCSRCGYCNSGGSCGVCAGTKKQSYYNRQNHNTQTRSYNNNSNYNTNMIGYIPVPVVHYSKKRINLRELPSLQAPIVIQIPKGIKIYLESKENNWYFASCYISENYYQGYIHQSVIK